MACCRALPRGVLTLPHYQENCVFNTGERHAAGNATKEVEAG